MEEPAAYYVVTDSGNT